MKGATRSWSFFHNMRQSKRHQGLSVDLYDIIDYLCDVRLLDTTYTHSKARMNSTLSVGGQIFVFLSIHKKYLLSKITVTWASGENFAFIHYHFPRYDIKSFRSLSLHYMLHVVGPKLLSLNWWLSNQVVFYRLQDALQSKIPYTFVCRREMFPWSCMEWFGEKRMKVSESAFPSSVSAKYFPL